MPRLSVIAIIISNSIPLLGVLFYDWSLFSVMFLYWAENVIAGLFNILRIAQSRKPAKPYEYSDMFGPNFPQTKWLVIPLFVVHYGIFMIVHGAFIFALFGPQDISFIGLAIAALSLFVSHGVSHMTNFIGKGERDKVSVPTLFTQPYHRMALLHITIVITGGLVISLGTPLPALLLMIILKIHFDVAAHVREHEKFSKEI